ncbi:hypothetical protein PHYBLDRAFT_173381 [Phycomyces blakesleeanus NRRL 1555(-)]|uniref:Uncharacterized protein n=1 Tax=Phycomyces blakesleeanus (strain ATCC 8743b / DSM 1359 / FGSC 10004 / NBRC 33097 / NRRL 1555) TaxID=763407 RepID=A0A167KLU5_PHYB8|nr:hypothetical protein PHYBLDRAFT_173381 [Phycomyces blakesleeanus NRRL 1555(-)]OAD68389.1 hypothetical protein PHYBLDRAFT_173381 [Phycomyces blakesleeanus NRRL 1555(-)]|eukprot:XP_018286429.1 hypothetical protein PHYBLDRAFT_173381 [Phycomyces blakesleeanus NRRL 1555(-)]
MLEANQNAPLKHTRRAVSWVEHTVKNSTLVSTNDLKAYRFIKSRGHKAIKIYSCLSSYTLVILHSIIEPSWSTDKSTDTSIVLSLLTSSAQHNYIAFVTSIFPFSGTSSPIFLDQCFYLRFR